MVISSNFLENTQIRYGLQKVSAHHGEIYEQLLPAVICGGGGEFRSVV